MALADVYDALISKRCYKMPFEHEAACAFIEAQAGMKFDPIVVQVFRQVSDQFAAIAVLCRDRNPGAVNLRAG